MTRVFGRTGESVDTVWRERPDGTIAAGDWAGVIVTAEDLDRRGGDRLRPLAAARGRPFDFAFVRGILASDLKVGWPLHRLQRFRDERLLRFVVIEAENVLDAEWIAANAPLHGVAVDYSTDDMAARYRVFDAAANAGVALVGLANSADAAALQMATPQITATLVAVDFTLPATAISAEEVDSAWDAYRSTNAEPPKLRGAHPPDFGS